MSINDGILQFSSQTLDHPPLSCQALYTHTHTPCAAAVLAEYTTIGILFKYFVGSVDYPIIIVVGVLTMIYTAYGGLYISIITDQAQGIVTALFILILVIYTAVTFRPESLPKPLPPNLGPNVVGYGAIYSLPCSLMAATVFSEAMWQKVWASESKSSVVFGGGVGFLLITLAVFLFGFGGWLAGWAGYITENTDYNLYLFQVRAARVYIRSPSAEPEWAFGGCAWCAYPVVSAR